MLDALLDAAAAWLRARGKERMVGPAGLLDERRERHPDRGLRAAPMIRQPWHPRYYQRLIEEAGMTKAMDLLMWNLEVDRARQGAAGDLGARGEGAKRARHPRAPDAPPPAAQGNRRLRRGLQLSVGEELGLRAVLQEGPGRLRAGHASRVRQALVHDRRARRHRRGRRHGDHDPRHQPGARKDERADCCRSAGGTSSTRASSPTACAWAFSASSPSTSTPGSPRKLYQMHFDAAEDRPQKGGEMGWILETNTAMNRGMEAMGGAGRQALPRVRAGVRGAPRQGADQTPAA